MEFSFDWEANEEKIKELKLFLQEQKGKKGALITVLHKAQDLFGYLPLEIQELVSEELRVPLSEIYGVATFYSRFTFIPKGENIVSVCLGTACYVKGAEDILKKIEDELGIKAGETTPDLKFSISSTRCIGECGIAPVISINDKAYGNLKVEDIEGILNEYK